jgi:RNA polymerase sigma-70 factor (ECF subfamily)
MLTALAAGSVARHSTNNGAMKISVVTDADLMARVAKQDKRALEELYARHASAALGLALRMMGERNSAEDLVQEAFWRVWRRAGTFELQRGQFAPWLLGIVHNLAIDEIRRRRVRPNALSTDADDETLMELPDRDADVVETVFVNVNAAQVRAALQALPDAQRDVIEMAYFEGLTHQEIAARLHEPLGTVHTRARLALQRLRQTLLPLHLDNVSG